MTRVVLIRPGATAFDEQHRVQGVLDLPLSARGRAQAAELADQLADHANGAWKALYCGPGENVVRTAETIARALGLRARRLEELRNLDQGLWQGLQIEEIKRRNMKLFRQWQENPRTVCPPRGETVESALERVRASLKPILRRHAGETIGLVVADPLARLVSCYLRRDNQVQIVEPAAARPVEWIEVPAEVVGRNGVPP